MKACWIIAVFVCTISVVVAQKGLSLRFVDDITSKVIVDTLVLVKGKTQPILLSNNYYFVTAKSVKSEMILSVPGMENYTINKAEFRKLKKYNSSKQVTVTLNTQENYVDQKLENLLQQAHRDTLIYLKSIHEVSRLIGRLDIPKSCLTEMEEFHHTRIGYIQLSCDPTGEISYKLIHTSDKITPRLEQFLLYKFSFLSYTVLENPLEKKIVYNLPMKVTNF